MRIAEIEIYADAGNTVVLRHPDRRFPGCLIQGDSLQAMLQSLKLVARESAGISDNAAVELNDVILGLAERLEHYKSVLAAHDLALPFVEERDG